MAFEHPSIAYGRIDAALRASKRGFLVVAAFSCFENMLLLSAPLYMMQVYDRVLASRSLETLLYLTLITAIALLVLAIINLARGRILAAIAIWVEQRLAPTLFEGAVQSRLKGAAYGPEAMADLAVVRSFVTSPGMTALFDLPWVAIFIAAAFLLHPYFGLLSVGCAAVLVSLALVGERLMRKPIQAINEANIALRRQLDATARNAEVIESMGMMRALSIRWTGRNAELTGPHGEVLGRSTLLASITKFVRLFVQTLALCIGAWLVVDQQATGGVMIAASVLLARAIAPFEQVIGSWKSIVSVRTSLRRLNAFANEPAYRPSAMSLPSPRGALSVEGLVYRARSPLVPLILRGVSFQLAAGEALAIIGPSGSGKSSLARLLVGAVAPTAGLVRLDNADIFSWSRDQIGEIIGYLPQDVELFEGTVAENIARMGAVDPKAVVEAAKMAGVHDLILRLPRGYETEIGEGGQHLSGGQRQRIALARAVFGDPRFVVLDEPNSNLDGDGEIALVNAIRGLKASGCTVVVVTHRASLLNHMDKILFLRDGQVDGFGTKQEVFTRFLGQPKRTAVAHVEAGGMVTTSAERERA